MSEVVVIVDVKAAPGKVDEVVRAFEECSVQTHAEEGCLLYALHRDNADPDHLVHVERWTTQEALDAHLKTDYVAALFAVAGTPGVLTAPPTLTFTTGLGLGDPVKGRL